MIIGFVAGLVCGIAASFAFGVFRWNGGASEEQTRMLQRELEHERAQHVIWKKAAEDLGRLIGVR